VEDFHTFYVSEIGVLFHNVCELENKSPDGAGRSGAYREAKWDLGITNSQTPVVSPAVNKKDIIIPEKSYTFGNVRIVDHSAGHSYPDGTYVPRLLIYIIG
jgi:hypothetical protein